MSRQTNIDACKTPLQRTGKVYALVFTIAIAAHVGLGERTAAQAQGVTQIPGLVDEGGIEGTAGGGAANGASDRFIQQGQLQQNQMPPNQLLQNENLQGNSGFPAPGLSAEDDRNSSQKHKNKKQRPQSDALSNSVSKLGGGLRNGMGMGMGILSRGMGMGMGMGMGAFGGKSGSGGGSRGNSAGQNNTGFGSGANGYGNQNGYNNTATTPNSAQSYREQWWAKHGRPMPTGQGQ